MKLIKDAQKMLQTNKFDKSELSKLVQPLLKDSKKVKSFIEKYTKKEQVEKLEKLRNELHAATLKKISV